MPSKGRDVARGQPTTAEQLVRNGFELMCKQLDVVQHGEGCAGCSSVYEVRVTKLADQHRRFGRYRLCGEASSAQPP